MAQVLMGGTDVRPFWVAPWLLAIGDDPILDVGNPVWSKAGISYSMAIMDMIDGWAKEQNDNGACIFETHVAAYFWSCTKAVESDSQTTL